jgi:VanZ family protein
MARLRLLAPLAWTCAIAWFSSDAWSRPSTQGLVGPLLHALAPWLAPEAIEALHWLVRKTAHAVEYGILAALWHWALGGWRASLLLSMLTAALDEAHQATTATRQGSLLDVAIDTLGAGMALALARLGTAATLARATDALLWLAALGGTVLLALHMGVGVPGGWLWASAPTGGVRASGADRGCRGGRRRRG